MVNLTIDRNDTFKFAYQNSRGQELFAIGYLFNAKDEGVIYIMKRTSCLQDRYSEDHIEECYRLNEMTPVRHGDVVEVEGQQYKVRILGNYSDAGRLIKI